jgi:hypothetical protein
MDSIINEASNAICVTYQLNLKCIIFTKNFAFGRIEI